MKSVLTVLLVLLLCSGCSKSTEAVADEILLKRVAPSLCVAIVTYGTGHGAGVAMVQVDCCHLDRNCKAKEN